MLDVISENNPANSEKCCTQMFKVGPDHNFMVRKVTNKRIIVTAYCSCLVLPKRAFFPLSNDPKQLPKHIK